MVRNLKVYVPDRATPILDLDSEMSVEEARQIAVQSGHTVCENADYTETTVGSNGREIRFKRVTGGTKG
jgi:hypothetical protein